MNDKNWFVHVEWVVMLVTLLGGFYLLDGKIERQGNRTDRLYEMFCEVQIQWKNDMLAMKRESDIRFKESDDRFYDLIKEGRK